MARTIQVEPAKIAKRDQLVADKRCTHCEEPFAENEQVRCGCCQACYQWITTNDNKRGDRRRDAIREGKMLPAGKGGRKPTHPARSRF